MEFRSNRFAIAALLAVALLAPASSHAARGRTLRTGQKNVYGAPGETTAGLVRSYVDTGLGFIKDQRTGLWWEKKGDDGGIHDKDATYTWTSDTKLADGTVFAEFLVGLNTPPCYADRCDWRLPTSFELYTLVDLGFSIPTAGPMFDAGCLPGCGVETCNCTNGGGYWSSSTPKDFEDLGWVVDFGTGAVVLGFKMQHYYVRAVRDDRP